MSPYDSNLVFTSMDVKKKIAFKGTRRVILMPDLEESLVKALKNAAEVSCQPQFNI